MLAFVDKIKPGGTELSAVKDSTSYGKFVANHKDALDTAQAAESGNVDNAAVQMGEALLRKGKFKLLRVVSACP